MLQLPHTGGLERSGVQLRRYHLPRAHGPADQSGPVRRLLLLCQWGECALCSVLFHLDRYFQQPLIASAMHCFSRHRVAGKTALSSTCKSPTTAPSGKVSLRAARQGIGRSVVRGECRRGIRPFAHTLKRPCASRCASTGPFISISFVAIVPRVLLVQVGAPYRERPFRCDRRLRRWWRKLERPARLHESTLTPSALLLGIRSL